MPTEKYLAIDLGAESGRAVLAEFDGARVSLQEAARFPTGRGPADIDSAGVRRWDFERIWSQVHSALLGALADSGGRLAGVGADSWGVDFGLLGGDGALLEPPLHYRNEANVAARDSVHARIPESDIWAKTGIQSLPFNTLYQLAAIQQRDPTLLERARRLLLMPDLIHNRLTAGASAACERTNASTTQLLDARSREWRTDVLESLGIPSHMLGPLVESGSRVGETAGSSVPVYAVGTHDTASAVAAVPAEIGGRWAFLSSGTWSLLGMELAEPVLAPGASRLGFSNEGAVGGKIRLLRNIMGLWLVQECRRGIAEKGQRDYSYAELAALAQQAAENGPLIDAVHDRYLAPRDMIDEIANACRESGQPRPGSPGELIRCCLESLALAYRRAVRGLEQLLSAPIEVLHTVGGGSQHRLLNQWTADACGIPVLAGPAEATALGNVLGQLIGAGRLSDWNEARIVSRNSVTPEVFTPDPAKSAPWEERDGRLG